MKQEGKKTLPFSRLKGRDKMQKKKSKIYLSLLVFGLTVSILGIFSQIIKAEEGKNTISTDSYTLVIPSEVSMDESQSSGAIDVTASNFADMYSLTVTAKSTNGFQLKNGSHSISYTMDTSKTFTSNNQTQSYALTIDDKSDATVAGSYTDQVTFDVTMTKNKYKLDLNGSVDGVEQNEGGDLNDDVATIQSVQVNGVDIDATSGNTHYAYGKTGWWAEYEAGTKVKFVISYDPTKYSLDRVENGKDKSASDYGMNVSIDNDNGTATIEGTISGVNAIANYGSSIGYATRIDLCFKTKTYNLVLDYYKLSVDGYDGSYEFEKDGEKFTRYTKTIRNVKYGQDISSYLNGVLLADNDINIVYLGWHTQDQPSNGWESIEVSTRAATTMPAPTDGSNTVTLYAWWTKTMYLDLNGQIEGEEMPEEGIMTDFATADILVQRNGMTEPVHNEIGVDDRYLKCLYGDTYTITPHAKDGFTYVGIAAKQFSDLTEVPGLTGTIDREHATNLHFYQNSEKANHWAVKVNLVFRRNTFTVKFDSNEGEGKMDDQSFSYKKEQSLSTNKFTKSGYKFIGWSKAKTYDEENPLITDGSDGSALTTEDKGSVTLYAQWEKVTSDTDESTSTDSTDSSSTDSETKSTESTNTTDSIVTDTEKTTELTSEEEQTEGE